MTDAWIGAGGWGYFRGPSGHPLEDYALAFRFVEVNATFYRHSTILDTRGDEGLSLEQAEAIAEAAVEECERFYPVFQFVLWGGKSPGEAIAAALIDTHGEA